VIRIKFFVLILCYFFIPFKGDGQFKIKDNLLALKERDLILIMNPTLHASQIASQNAAVAGLGLLLNYNEQFALGPLYRITLNRIALPNSRGENRFQLRNMGIHFQYIVDPHTKFQLSFPLTAGIESLLYAGGIQLNPGDKSKYMFLEPGISLDIKIIKYVKFGVGLRYHFVPNVSYYTLQSGDLSSIEVVFSAMFGIFNFRTPTKLRI
jgi:hypothetical protein